MHSIVMKSLAKILSLRSEMNKRLNIVGWGAYLALIYVHVRTFTFSMRLCGRKSVKFYRNHGEQSVKAIQMTAQSRWNDKKSPENTHQRTFKLISMLRIGHLLLFLVVVRFVD